ncbi:MAG: hypothetical protein N4A33_13230 [Bacteriovoracaceae bacterium]|jgi:hypothetical protein|nr:hypothetical protein [Bacteriovoracaceae bacterium]
MKKFLLFMLSLTVLISCGGENNTGGVDSSTYKYSYTGQVTVFSNSAILEMQGSQRLNLMPKTQQVASDLFNMQGKTVSVYSNKAPYSLGYAQGTFGATSTGFDVEAVQMSGVNSSHTGNNSNQLCGHLTASYGDFDINYYIGSYYVIAQSGSQAHNVLIQFPDQYVAKNVCATVTHTSGSTAYISHISQQ